MWHRCRNTKLQYVCSYRLHKQKSSTKVHSHTHTHFVSVIVLYRFSPYTHWLMSSQPLLVTKNTHIGALNGSVNNKPTHAHIPHTFFLLASRRHCLQEVFLQNWFSRHAWPHVHDYVTRNGSCLPFRYTERAQLHATVLSVCCLISPPSLSWSPVTSSLFKWRESN